MASRYRLIGELELVKVEESSDTSSITSSTSSEASSTSSSETAPGPWNISQSPMNIHLGGANQPAEIDAAIDSGWNGGFATLARSRSQLDAFLQHMQSLDKRCYLTLHSDLHQAAEVEWLVNHPALARHVSGIETHGNLWTDAPWVNLRDKLIDRGLQGLLFVRHPMYSGSNNPNARSWPQRSRLWYPLAPSGDVPTQRCNRFDMPIYPLKTLADFKLASGSNQIHVWLQGFGIPMTQDSWDDPQSHTADRGAIAPGVLHLLTQLWNAHLSGARNVSFHCHSGVWDVGQRPSRYDRLWNRLVMVTNKYLAGPGNWPYNSEGAFRCENPFVGVVDGGQDLGNLNSSRY